MQTKYRKTKSFIIFSSNTHIQRIERAPRSASETHGVFGLPAILGAQGTRAGGLGKARARGKDVSLDSTSVLVLLVLFFHP